MFDSDSLAQVLPALRDGQAPHIIVKVLFRKESGVRVARALYCAYVEMGPAYDDQRHKLKGTGYQLQLAIDRAGEGGPGTFKHRENRASKRDPARPPLQPALWQRQK